MRIFELLNPNQPQDPNQSPDQNQEDDDDGKFDADKVDSNLQDLSQQIDDQQAQPQQPGGDQPPPELDNQNPEPIDSSLMSQIKSQPYTQRYKFDDNSPINPIKIAGMQIDELSNLRNMVRYKMELLTLHDQVGVEEDQNMVFYNDLMRFISTVLHFKKSDTKSQLAATNPTPPYQQA